MDFSQYTTKETKEVLELLKTRESGLLEKEVLERQKTYGLNEIRVKEIGLIDILIRQFKSPFFYLLLIASLIAFLVNEKTNGFVILSFIIVNVIIGFSQEARAVRTAAILKKYISPQARVLRNGEEEVIDQKFLVPGDIILLEAGNIVPTDARILSSENFWVDESVLTGESVAVSKTNKALLKEAKEIFQAENIIFASTVVFSGEAETVVINTGRKTFFGEVAKLTGENIRESAYEKSILEFSRIILRLVVVSIVFIFLANLIIKKGKIDFFEFLIFCIALIVSIIPEALPVVVTFALSQGALRLARNKVVVKRLSAIEDLGDIEVLCTDKTGTLTENKLTLEGVHSSDKEKCLRFGLLSSHYIKEKAESVKSPFDFAICEKAGPKICHNLGGFKEIGEIPFDNERLISSSLIENGDKKKFLVVKGVLEVVLELCSKFETEFDSHLTKDETISKIKEQTREEWRLGKRILVIAFKEFNKSEYSKQDEQDLTFLGYFSFVDPLKKTAKSAIELAKKMGLQIKILTGDSQEVGGAVGKEIGLVDNPEETISGKELEALVGEDFERACEKFHIFGRVSPKTKFKIIETLQKKFEVGFLGEGINDAPALKIANVAIAVREGVDIAREVSDIILLKKDLRIIVEGIKEGRNIFTNINKYIKCTLASNFGNFYSIAVISLFINFLPMLPIQILLGNLLSDFPLISITTDSVDVEELKKPKSSQFSRFIGLIFFLALVSTIFDFIFWIIFRHREPALIQSLWFIETILTQIFLIFLVRTQHLFIKAKRPSFPLIILTILAGLLIIFLPFSGFGKSFFRFVSPPINSLSVVFILIIFYVIISEIVKLIYFNWKNKRTVDNG